MPGPSNTLPAADRTSRPGSPLLDEPPQSPEDGQTKDRSVTAAPAARVPPPGLTPLGRNRGVESTSSLRSTALARGAVALLPPLPRQSVGRFVNARLLRGLSLLIRPALSQQRGFVNKPTYKPIQKLPTSPTIQSGFRFQGPDGASRNVLDLQERLSANTPGPARYETLQDPGAGDIEELLRKHGGGVSLSLYGLRGQEETAIWPRMHTVLVTAVLRGDDGKRWAVVVDGDDLSKNPITAQANAYADDRGKLLHELEQEDFDHIQSQLNESSGEPTFGQAMYRFIDLDDVIEKHHTIIARDKAGSALRAGEAVYDRSSSSTTGNNIPTEVEQALKAQINTGQKAVEQFWDSPPNLSSLVDRVRQLALIAGAEVPAIGTSRRAEISDAYEEIFSNLNAFDLAPLTSTERHLLALVYKELFGQRRLLPPALFQATGRFDPAHTQARLQQVEALVEAMKPTLAGVRLEELDVSARTELMTKMVDTARKVLEFSSPVDVRVENEADPDSPHACAAVFRKGAGYEIVFHPLAFQDGLSILGTVTQECVHVTQFEQIDAAQANDAVRKSREAGSAERLQGPLLPRERVAEGHLLNLGLSRESAPRDYPMRLQHERDGWMTEVATKIVAAHTEEFGSLAAHASIYADISMDELRQNGVDGILAFYARDRFGVDMGHLAALCGIRAGDEGSASWVDPSIPLAELKAFLLKKLAASADDVPMDNLLSEFRADLLGQVVDVLDAAEQEDHPYRMDATLLISSVHEAIWLEPPFRFDQAHDVGNLVAQCRSVAEQVQTPLGRTLLYQHALRRVGELGLTVDDEVETQLKEAAGVVRH